MDAAPERYWQIEFGLAASALEAVEDLLWAASALSVSAVPEADAPDLFEPDPGATPLWQSVRLQALFASEALALAAAAAVTNALRGDAAGTPGTAAAAAAEAEAAGDRVNAPAPGFAPTIELRCVVNEDWEDAWRQHVKPLCLGGRLWVCPTGERTPDMGEHVVLLDAGLAFGTGAHATTALCLEWLASQAVRDARVVDFGCGSGILGIAALVLGARSVLAVDHDPQAHRATADNAANNGVAERLQLVDDAALSPGCADVLLANILAGTLIDLAPLLTDCVADGGRVALSGVIAHQAETVMAAYPAFEFAPPMQREEWVCLAGRRRPRAAAPRTP